MRQHLWVHLVPLPGRGYRADEPLLLVVSLRPQYHHVPNLRRHRHEHSAGHRVGTHKSMRRGLFGRRRTSKFELCRQLPRRSTVLSTRLHGAASARVSRGLLRWARRVLRPHLRERGRGGDSNPNGCGLCKSRGMLPVVDVNRISTQYSGCTSRTRPCTSTSAGRTPTPTTALSDVGCSLETQTGLEDGRISTFNRCPPTRAGLATRFLSTEQIVGKRFAPLAPTLLRLDGHPDILSATECEIACVQTSACRAWDYSERGFNLYGAPAYQTRRDLEDYRTRVVVDSTLVASNSARAGLLRERSRAPGHHRVRNKMMGTQTAYPRPARTTTPTPSQSARRGVCTPAKHYTGGVG